MLCAAQPMPTEVPDWIPVLPAADRIQGVDERWAWSPGAEEVLQEQRRYGRMVPVDVNHALQLRAWSGDGTPACGWLVAWEVRDGQLMARVEWTDEGRELLQARKYRYHSPAYVLANDVIRYVESVSLVNIPNLRFPALHARGGPMGRIQQALGLPDTASEEETVRAIQRRVAPGPLDTGGEIGLVPKADLEAALARAASAETQLHARQAQDRETRAGSLVDGAIAKRLVVPATRQFYVDLAKDDAGYHRVETHFASLSPVIGTDPPPSGDPPGSGADGDGPHDRQVREGLGFTEEEWRNG